jgi:hypothetical protein
MLGLSALKLLYSAKGPPVTSTSQLNGVQRTAFSERQQLAQAVQRSVHRYTESVALRSYDVEDASFLMQC